MRAVATITPIRRSGRSRGWTTSATSPPPTAGPTVPGGRGLVIAEGVLVVRRLLDSPYPLRALLGVPRRLDELAADLAGPRRAGLRDRPATRWPPWSGSTSTAGCSRWPDRAAPPDLDALLRGARVLAVLEGVNDHENLGALFRNAAALGVDAVLLGPRCADPLYRRSVRVSMGHVLRVPFAELPEPWPAALDRAAGAPACGWPRSPRPPTRCR